MELNIIFLIILFWLLGQSADIVIRALIRIGVRLRLSRFVVGFFILGMATSMPELLVGINSVIEGLPVLSLGHLIGASIILLSFITGIFAFLNREFKTVSFKLKELLFIDLLILLPFILSVDKKLSMLDGLFIIAFFGLYFFYKFQQRGKFHDGIEAENHIRTKDAVGSLVLGLVLLLLFSRLVVGSAEEIINVFHLSPLVFGIVVLAIGTNLPELSIAYKSRLSSKKSFAFGNILGSAAANSLIAGIVSFLKPISIVNYQALLFSGFALFASVVIFNLFLLSGRSLTRKEGVFMIAFYILFLAIVVNMGFI